MVTGTGDSKDVPLGDKAAAPLGEEHAEVLVVPAVVLVPLVPVIDESLRFPA